MSFFVFPALFEPRRARRVEYRHQRYADVREYCLPEPRVARRAEDEENALDAADRQARSMSLRYTHDEVFGSVREMLGHDSEATAL